MTFGLVFRGYQYRFGLRRFEFIAEVIGLTFGIAALFNTCIDCFELLSAGRLYSEESEVFLAKLDIEKTRLLIWSETVGLLENVIDGGLALLDDSKRCDSTQNCLVQVKYCLDGRSTPEVSSSSCAYIRVAAYLRERLSKRLLDHHGDVRRAERSVYLIQQPHQTDRILKLQRDPYHV